MAAGGVILKALFNVVEKTVQNVNKVLAGLLLLIEPLFEAKNLTGIY